MKIWARGGEGEGATISSMLFKSSRLFETGNYSKGKRIIIHNFGKNREKAQNFRHSLYLYEEVFKQGFITVINLCVVSRGVFLLPSPPLFTPILDIVPHFSQSALHLHFRFIIKSPAAVRFPPKPASLKSGGKGVRRQHRTLNSRTLKAKQTIRIHNFHVVLECCRFWIYQNWDNSKPLFIFHGKIPLDTSLTYL